MQMFRRFSETGTYAVNCSGESLKFPFGTNVRFSAFSSWLACHCHRRTPIGTQYYRQLAATDATVARKVRVLPSFRCTPEFRLPRIESCSIEQEDLVPGGRSKMP
jgi:hypothetical protein